VAVAVAAQVRNEKTILGPWLKYRFEAYRSILDVLRNHSKLLQLYHVRARRRGPKLRAHVR
jgi:hypothetical protein